MGNSTKKLNFKRALGCFFAAYIIVSVLATAISVTYAIIYKSAPAMNGTSMMQAPSFVATVPYHVLIMLLVWPFFTRIYFQKRMQQLRETLWLSACWVLTAIAVDFVGFVLIKHPYSFTPYEFYVLYQPWISLIYAAIFLSPFIRLVMLQFAKQATPKA